MKLRALVAAVLLAATTLPLVPQDAAAQLPFSIRLSGLYARQNASISANAGGVDVGATDTASNALGAEVRVGLPVIGFDLGAHYLRHFGDADPDFDTEVDGLSSLGLSGNEFALFAEKRFPLVPMSPVKPFLGVGASYARIELSSEIDFTAGAEDVSSSANVFRLYGVGGIDLIGGLGLVARAGYAFSGTYELEVDAPISGGATADVDYDGLYLSVGVSLFGI